MIFLIFQKKTIYIFLFADDTNIYYESNDLKQGSQVSGEPGEVMENKKQPQKSGR